MQSTTTTPDVPLPAGAHMLSDFKDWDYQFRLVWGPGRPVDGTDIVLSPVAAQLPDGSIDLDGAVADEEPKVMIDKVRDGHVWDCLSVTVQGARNLAAALLAAADEVDGWAAK